VFHHSFAFSKGQAIFAVLWVASISNSWIVIAASLACDWVRLMLVRLVKVIWHFVTTRLVVVFTFMKVVQD
jgi:hypothetical protein